MQWTTVSVGFLAITVFNILQSRYVRRREYELGYRDACLDCMKGSHTSRWDSKDPSTLFKLSGKRFEEIRFWSNPL